MNTILETTSPVCLKVNHEPSSHLLRRYCLLLRWLAAVLILGITANNSTLADTQDKMSQSHGEATDIPNPMHFSSEGNVRIDGKRIDYKVFAGQLLMRNSKGEPIALFGYTAYTKIGDSAADRPVLFAYNGGPGSASMWLHMGILGPQRTVLDDPNFTTRAPFKRVNNNFSVLDVADLVMIDPVGTGYSKAVGDAEDKDFWGVDNDIRSVSEFIARWTTVNNRWLSPKYLLGESYGGMRSGGVAYDLLTRHNLTLNGVILVSPFMDYVGGFAGLPFDQPYINFLSSYAATAWYHHVSDYRPDTVEQIVAEAEMFARGDYARALQLGAQLGDDDRQAILNRLAQLTGVAASYWDAANLRIDESRFTKELQRLAGKNVGRIDSRYVGDAINHIGESVAYDPFFPAVGPAVVATFNDYYSRDLGVTSDTPYVTSARLWQDWTFNHNTPGVGEVAAANTGIDLNRAMLQNPHMRILVQQGFYDLATPYGGTRYFLDQLRLPEHLRSNITEAYYEAGHMMYIHEESMAKFKMDLAKFIAQ